MDAATGLVYVGGGQYYDPATGRFLTPVNRDGTNPYVPQRGGDPLGAVLAPFALLALLGGRRKNRGKFDKLILMLVLMIAVAGGVAACDTPPPPPTNTSSPPTQPPRAISKPKKTPIPTPLPTPSELTAAGLDCKSNINLCRELSLSGITRRESWLGTFYDTDPFTLTGKRTLTEEEYHDGINWSNKPLCSQGISIANSEECIFTYRNPKAELHTVVLHHGGNEVAADPNDGPAYMRKVHEWHINPDNNLEDIDIDYHFGVSASGEILEGRPIYIRGQHVGEANTGRLGILIAGSFDDPENPIRPTQVQIDSTIKLINDLKGLGYQFRYLGGHCEFPSDGSTCPGQFFQVEDQSGQYINAVDYIAINTGLNRENIPGTIGATPTP
jgi:hypothetical protein